MRFRVKVSYGHDSKYSVHAGSRTVRNVVIVFECEIVCNTKSCTITGVSVAGVSFGDPICHMFLITGVPQSSDLVSPASLSSPETCLFSLSRVMTILHNAEKYKHVIICAFFDFYFELAKKPAFICIAKTIFSFK